MLAQVGCNFCVLIMAPMKTSVCVESGNLETCLRT